MKKKVIIIDDHVLFSNALKKLIESFHEFTVINKCSNGKEYLEVAKKQKTHPDCILLDVKMPIMDGISTMEWLSENSPEIPVLVLSMEDDEERIIKMLKLGAKGYILKDIDPSQFRHALQTVCNGGFYHTGLTNSILLNQVTQTKTEIKINLKENEIQFLNLICSELTYKGIAKKMFLSPKTIDGYRENLFKKTGVKSRTGLVMWAIKSGIVNI